MPFEISIDLNPSLIKPVKRWVKSFKKFEPYWVTYPELKETRLTLSAPSFPFLLAYADRADSNELDLKRLRKLGRDAIEQRAEQSVDPRELRALARALENLEILHDGEFLDQGAPFAEAILEQ